MVSRVLRVWIQGRPFCVVLWGGRHVIPGGGKTPFGWGDDTSRDLTGTTLPQWDVKLAFVMVPVGGAAPARYPYMDGVLGLGSHTHLGIRFWVPIGSGAIHPHIGPLDEGRRAFVVNTQSTCGSLLDGSDGTHGVVDGLLWYMYLYGSLVGRWGPLGVVDWYDKCFMSVRVVWIPKPSPGASWGAHVQLVGDGGQVTLGYGTTNKLTTTGDQCHPLRWHPNPYFYPPPHAKVRGGTWDTLDLLNCWILIHNGIPKNHGYLDTVYTNGWIPKTTNGYHIYTLNTRYPIPVITMYPQIPHPHHTKYPFYYPPSPSKSPSQTRPLYLGVPNHYTINPVLVPVVVRGGCGLGFVFGYVWDNGSLPVVLGTLSGWGTGVLWQTALSHRGGKGPYPRATTCTVLHIKLPNTRVLGGTGDLIVFGGDLAVFGTLERVLAEGSIGWVLGMVGSSYDWWLIWLWWLVVGTGGGLVGALVLGGMGNYPGLGVLGITFDLDVLE
ncbi:hypothetical protein G9A89_000709 [Geosiphon pyriformis]|nr:hypothetical protein G9A89_000709 [Geosiphon pyriformis]